MLKGVLFGFGNMGEAVARQMAKRKDVQLIGAMDPTEERREVAAGTYGLKTAASTDATLNLGKIDFALVTSPNAFHCEQVLKAVAAGAHVYCEKPLALSVAECDKMVDAVEKAGRANVVNFSFRYNGVGRMFKKLLDDGAIGEVLSAWQLRSRGYGLHCAGARHPAVVRPDQSGGWTMHHMCHDIDLLNWTVGPFRRVWSLARSTVPEGPSEEIIWAMAELERPGQATRPMAMLGDAVHRMRIEEQGVTGRGGTMRLEHRDGQAVVVVQPEGGDPGLRSGSGKPLPEQVHATEGLAEPGGGLGHFFDCLQNGTQSQVTFRDARAAVQVALACQLSARAGGTPVTLSA